MPLFLRFAEAPAVPLVCTVMQKKQPAVRRAVGRRCGEDYRTKKAERVTHSYELYLFWISLVQFIENLY